MYSSKYPNRFDIPAAVMRAVGTNGVCEAFAALSAGERENFCDSLSVTPRREGLVLYGREAPASRRFDGSGLC